MLYKIKTKCKENIVTAFYASFYKINESKDLFEFFEEQNECLAICKLSELKSITIDNVLVMTTNPMTKKREVFI